jgi:hypothetical protein
MPEFVTILEHIERRTYIKGKFKGKFIGYLDHRKSDLQHEYFYDLEIISGEIKTSKDEASIRHWESGESEEFQSVEQFLTRLPESLTLEVESKEGATKYYNINLNESKLSNYKLFNQVYEDSKVYGDITGDISGYMKHYDTEEIEIELIPLVDDTIIIPPAGNIIKTSKLTGRTEVSGNYKRSEYYYSDGLTYWGNWIRQNKQIGFSFLGILGGVIQILFLLIIVIVLFAIAWQLILPLIIITGIFYLLSILQPVIIRLWSWLMQLLGFAFLMFLVYSIITLFTNPIHNSVKQKVAINSPKEIKKISPDPISEDSIISHYRIWQDYNSNEYSGIINVKVSDFRNGANYRNSIYVSPKNSNQYNYVVSKVYDFDKNKLSLLYSMFDNLKVEHNLSETQFAEVITSCIQDIPYTLILNNDCNPNLYNDKFISDYLVNGGRCVGFVKFGFLSPSEFMGSLIGDCDTRTLLLFTVLNHYNYDVAMFGSEFYRHSLIGINLPYKGISKTINGKRYVLWETTEQGIPPGIISRKISNLNFWNVTLISNNNISI